MDGRSGPGSFPGDHGLECRIARVGAVLSAVCGVHCVLTPLLVGVLPLVGLGFLMHGTVEIVIVGAALALAAVSAVLGLRRHGSASVAAAYAISMVLLVAGLAVGEVSPLGRTLLVVGAVALAVAHLANHRRSHSHPARVRAGVVEGS